jgi:hypothetical protein
VGVDHEVSMIFSNASAKDDESWSNANTTLARIRQLKKKRKKKKKTDKILWDSSPYSNDEEWSDAESRS